ncbi:MAG: hypothetical protein IH973_04400 [Myxococcales bacterium]|nr:hypothetical protein [Myxococcales bacterium]
MHTLKQKLQRLWFAMLLALVGTNSALAAEVGTETSAPAVAAVPAIDLDALNKDRKQKAGLYPISPRVSRYLAAAATAVDDEDPAGAKQLLLKLHQNRLNLYERALVFRMLAHVASGANEPEVAIGYFERFLDQEMLPIRDEARARFQIAQLYASMQQWQLTIDSLKECFRYFEEPDPLGFYLMGIAYYQQGNFEDAIFQAKLSVERAREPKESWLRLLAALYSETQDFGNATPVLEELILRFPKKQYWVQLSLLYGARENYRRALSVQQVAYVQGFLDNDKEIRRLALSYLYHDLPYPAAIVLDKALADGMVARDSKAYELLANSWIAAREYERSLEPLRLAAELSEDGNLYVRLGQVHMQREAWPEAAVLLSQAVAKGSLDNPGNADLLLGIAYYNDASLQSARSSFGRARKYDATRAEADRWITHIDSETTDAEG